MNADVNSDVLAMVVLAMVQDLLKHAKERALTVTVEKQQIFHEENTDAGTPRIFSDEAKLVILVRK